MNTVRSLMSYTF